MQLTGSSWTGAELSDADFAKLAQSAVMQGDIPALQKLTMAAADHSTIWLSQDGQVLLVDILSLLLDTVAESQIAHVIDTVALFPQVMREQAHDLLLCAFAPDGKLANPVDLDDAALLCLALLKGMTGESDSAISLIGAAIGNRQSPVFFQSAKFLRNYLIQNSAEAVFKPKLIIWDLDDTLWQGTLADRDEPVLNERRASFIRALNRHGIISAICSKNDFDTARQKLEAFGLWEEFVFPQIAFVPKGAVVKQMIADMQLRPTNVLFVDDNPHNLHEVAAAVPGIHIMNATSEECDTLLQHIVDDHAQVSRNRIAEYRILETRVKERLQTCLTDEAFLLQSGIHATYTHRMDNLDFADRIEELINRSNQLNYTQSRIETGSLHRLIMNVSDYDVFSAFVWDKYGHYGLVGVAIYDKAARRLTHFAFSCRIMHMGVEDFLLRALVDRYGEINLSLLRKPLPAQSSAAIIPECFSDPEIREYILAEAAPRDWSQVRLRLMCECQSGAFHHYSRVPDEYDFDNLPRIFTLPMLLTGAYKEQTFPEFLVYTPATDYMDWRWQEVMPRIDTAVYVDCVDRFCDMVLEGNHKVLLFLPPENGSEARYDVLPTCTAPELKERNRRFNALWRAATVRHSEHIQYIDLSDFVAEADMMGHAYHYVPSVLQRMTGMIDDWYEGKK